jgi:hypothetical protein
MNNDERQIATFLWRSLVNGRLTKLSKKTSPAKTEKGSVKEWYYSQECIPTSNWHALLTVVLPWKQLRTPSSTQSLSSLSASIISTH